MFTAVLLWATIIGGIMYSHVVFMSSYLPNLPASTSLVKGPYGLVDENFWKTFHPLLIISLLITVGLHWKVVERRKFILTATGIYFLILVITFSWFVPELISFADSASSNIPGEEWAARGRRWERLSWVRGGFMYLGFGLLLVALTKGCMKAIVIRPQQRRSTAIRPQQTNGVIADEAAMI